MNVISDPSSISTPSIAELRLQVLKELRSGCSENEALAYLRPHWGRLRVARSDANEAAQWADVLTAACIKGQARLYRRVFRSLALSPALPAEHLVSACLSEKAAMVQAVLALSHPVPLSEPGSATQLTFNLPTTRTVVALARVLFADPRLQEAGCLTEAWAGVGKRGHSAAISVLKPVHDRHLSSGQATPHQLVRAWRVALTQWVLGAEPDQDMAGTVAQMWAMITPEQIIHHLNDYLDTPVGPVSVGFAVIDERLTRDNPHVAQALRVHAFPIEQWRSLFFQSGGITWMPREGASRRANQTQELTPSTPVRVRSRP